MELSITCKMFKGSSDQLVIAPSDDQALVVTPESQTLTSNCLDVTRAQDTLSEGHVQNTGDTDTCVNESAAGMSAEVSSVGKRHISYPVQRQGLRKKTLSLNPEEREALENLIEEVIMDGVGEGVIDSDASSSDDDGADDAQKSSRQGKTASGHSHALDTSKNGSGSKGGKKFYPGQLKVALKHMHDLPPRFVRKLAKAQVFLESSGGSLYTKSSVKVGRIEEEEEYSGAVKDDGNLPVVCSISASALPERDREKARLKENKVKEAKKKIRSLLSDRDQYVDERFVAASLSDGSGQNVSTLPKELAHNDIVKSDLPVNTCLLEQGAINCGDLEREMIAGNKSVSQATCMSQTAVSEMEHNESQPLLASTDALSVEAADFVPIRSTCIASPKHHVSPIVAWPSSNAIRQSHTSPTNTTYQLPGPVMHAVPPYPLNCPTPEAQFWIHPPISGTGAGYYGSTAPVVGISDIASCIPSGVFQPSYATYSVPQQYSLPGYPAVPPYMYQNLQPPTQSVVVPAYSVSTFNNPESYPVSVPIGGQYGITSPAAIAKSCARQSSHSAVNSSQSENILCGQPGSLNSSWPGCSTESSMMPSDLYGQRHDLPNECSRLLPLQQPENFPGMRPPDVPSSLSKLHISDSSIQSVSTVSERSGIALNQAVSTTHNAQGPLTKPIRGMHPMNSTSFGSRLPNAHPRHLGSQSLSTRFMTKPRSLHGRQNRQPIFGSNNNQQWSSANFHESVPSSQTNPSAAVACNQPAINSHSIPQNRQSLSRNSTVNPYDIISPFCLMGTQQVSGMSHKKQFSGSQECTDDKVTICICANSIQTPPSAMLCQTSGIQNSSSPCSVVTHEYTGSSYCLLSPNQPVQVKSVDTTDQAVAEVVELKVDDPGQIHSSVCCSVHETVSCAVCQLDGALTGSSIQRVSQTVADLGIVDANCEGHKLSSSVSVNRTNLIQELREHNSNSVNIASSNLCNIDIALENEDSRSQNQLDVKLLETSDGDQIAADDCGVLVDKVNAVADIALNDVEGFKNVHSLPANCVTVTLSSSFTTRLVELFGPVPASLGDVNSHEGYKVNLDEVVAHLIYKCWLQSATDDEK